MLVCVQGASDDCHILDIQNVTVTAVLRLMVITSCLLCAVSELSGQCQYETYIDVTRQQMSPQGLDSRSIPL